MFFVSLAIAAEAGPFYVVVGTFSSERRAAEFADAIDGLFHDAAYIFDAQRKVYHVYTRETAVQHEAEEARHAVQKESGFGHAWVFTDFASVGAEGVVLASTSAGDPARLELYTGGSVLLSAQDNSYLSYTNGVHASTPQDAHAVVQTLKFFAETTSGVRLPAKVVLMNSHGKALENFKTDALVSFTVKESGQSLTFLCEVPGYSSDIKTVALGRLVDSHDIQKNEEGVWEIRFAVSRVDVDEVKLLYRHVFYRDASVLRRSSRKQIDALVTLLKANPDWRIVINSHCNEGYKRSIKVTRVSYFDLKDAAEKSGTDKQLTRERAETLRDYLAYQGIDESRITVMGWGSLDMLVKGKEDAAGINERVEVEILK